MSILYPERVFSRSSAREIDRRAIEHYRLPGIVLMENASRGLAGHAMKMLNWPNQTQDGNVLILAGPGNNGGDGFAAARHLRNAGLNVTIVLITPPARINGDAGTMLEVCRAMRLTIIEAFENPTSLSALPSHDLVIDALLGTGVTQPVRDPIAAAIHWLNTGQDAPVLACDVPSGLDCDTGQPLGIAVRADATVTFVGVKRGFLEPEARRFTGEVKIVPIGVPRELVEELGQRLKE
jgi:NAD(P)H-hydrate epimerase